MRTEPVADLRPPGALGDIPQLSLRPSITLPPGRSKVENSRQLAIACRPACTRHDDPLPTKQVRVWIILRPKVDALQGTSGMHDTSRGDVVLSLEEMVELVAMGEVHREREHHTVGHDPERSAIDPVGTAFVDSSDQRLDVIRKGDVVMLRIGDVMARA